MCASGYTLVVSSSLGLYLFRYGALTRFVVLGMDSFLWGRPEPVVLVSSVTAVALSHGMVHPVWHFSIIVCRVHSCAQPLMPCSSPGVCVTPSGSLKATSSLPAWFCHILQPFCFCSKSYLQPLFFLLRQGKPKFKVILPQVPEL